jgi:DNA-binding transcriptional regulator YiaG
MRTNSYEKKPFPWRCTTCGEKAIYGATVDYTGTMHHELVPYSVHVPALKAARCTNCGTIKLDAEALDLLTVAFMRQLNLLAPDQIQEGRLKSSLSQAQLATALGISDAAVERLETGGQIQTRSLDNLMRLFFGLPQVREILTTQQISSLPYPMSPQT